jgi:putative aldouronate transport system substrate-binding protein
MFKKKLTGLVLLIGIGTALVYGGAGKEGSSAQAEEGPFTMSMFALPYAGDLPDFTSNVGQKIMEHTKTNLVIDWGSPTSSEFMQQFNLLMAAGKDLPMVSFVSDIKNTSMIQGMQAGAFWEIGPYLKDFTNLSKMSPIVLQNTSYEGKNYMLYRARDIARYGIIFRKDWVERLGMKNPTSLDELYNVLKAFTFQDPDGNGKNDTYGLSLSGIEPVNILASYFGAPNGYAVDASGKFTADFMTQEYFNALSFLRKLYQEKIMNDDFAAINGNQMADNITRGKGGMYFAMMYAAGENRHNDLYTLFPGAQLDVEGRINGPKGIRTPATSGYSGGFVFTKSAIKDEKTLRSCLNFFDRMADKEMQDLLRWGIIGRHSTIVGGVPTQTTEQMTLYATEVNCFRTLKTHDGKLETQGQMSLLAKKYWQQTWDNESIAVVNPAEALISTTALERGSELAKIKQDAATQYISGLIDEAGWKEAVNKWLGSGGRKILDEYAAEYAKGK